MGAGIAQVAAQSGLAVVLIDVSPDYVQKGLAGIRPQLDKAVSKGKLKAEDAPPPALRLQAGPGAQDGAPAQFAVEPGPEDEPDKTQVCSDPPRAPPPVA